MKKYSTLIIGAGLAGYMVAKSLRKHDADCSLALVTTQDGAFYSKPLLSTSLTKQKTPDALVVSDANVMAQQLDADIFTLTEVVHIDRSAQVVLVVDRSGEKTQLHYDQLVLALGADKKQVPLSGDAVDSVVSVNSLMDYRAFRQQLEGKKRVAILGSGLVGCEFANDLIQNEFAVHVIAPDAYPLLQFVPEMVGFSVQKGLAKAGVQWHLSAFAKDVSHLGDAYQVTLSDGSVVAADLVLSAVGLTPNVAIAKQAGLQTQVGICVNNQFQTNDPHIYAIGDCAQVDGVVRMYVAPILKGAEALAKTLAGVQTAIHYPVMPIVIKTTLHPVVAVPPVTNTPGSWEITGDANNVRALFVSPSGELSGFALSGASVAERSVLTKKMME